MFYIILLLKIEKKDDDAEQEEILDNQFETDYINFNDIIPNHYNGRKNDNEIIM